MLLCRGTERAVRRPHLSKAQALRRPLVNSSNSSVVHLAHAAEPTGEPRIEEPKRHATAGALIDADGLPKLVGQHAQRLIRGTLSAFEVRALTVPRCPRYAR